MNLSLRATLEGAQGATPVAVTQGLGNNAKISLYDPSGFPKAISSQSVKPSKTAAKASSKSGKTMIPGFLAPSIAIFLGVMIGALGWGGAGIFCGLIAGMVLGSLINNCLDKRGRLKWNKSTLPPKERRILRVLS